MDYFVYFSLIIIVILGIYQFYFWTLNKLIMIKIDFALLLIFVLPTLSIAQKHQTETNGDISNDTLDSQLLKDDSSSKYSSYISIDSSNNYEAYTAQTDEKAPIDSTFHKELTIGLDHVSNSRFREALAIFDSMEKVFPHHPAPNFYKAATYQSWMLTYRINKFQNELYENSELAIEKGNRLLENDNDPWLNFYVGAAYGYKALHLFRQHNWISAYFNSRDGISNFENALEKVPNLYDCYYGLGAYNYWRTAKSKFIRFIIFWMTDKRELGLEQMQLSVERGRYCPYEAINGLIIAQYHHGSYNKALELNNIAMKLSDPPSLPTLYLRARLMTRFDKWSEAQDIFQGILRMLEIQTYQSVSFQVECKYWIARAFNYQNQTGEAFELVKQALAQSKNWVKDNELENPFEGFDTIKQLLEELHDKLESEINIDKSKQVTEN